MTSNYQESYSFTNEDRAVLATLTVPIPSNEQKRIEILRQSKLTDEASVESGFGRFTSLATRLFDMPYAAISFVEIDSIHFQSKVGFEVDGLSRSDWFDAYTILPDSSEVYVIPDCSMDQRYRDKSFVKGGPRIKFYAGAAIIIDNVKIGVLSIMDTQPHLHFGLEEKENLLDLGAAVAQLCKEKLQKTLNLSAERANIVVSMMHHLRTPMTSLNFATSLLCNDIQQIKEDAAIDPNSSETPSSIQQQQQPPAAEKKEDTTAQSTTTANGDMKQMPTLFNSFESSFSEISMALNQLNVLVDSSLSLGQAIIKCSHQDSQLLSPPMAATNATSTVDPRRGKFSEINLIDYLREMFHHHLPIHNNHLDIEWIIETIDLARGTHVTFPDAIMLIVISTVSHMSTESNSLGFYFSFIPAEEDDFEYPEMINKMLEGKLSVKIFAKDEKGLSINPSDGSHKNINSTTVHASTLPSFAAINTAMDTDGAELLTKQNFLSIDKILRAINGSSKEYVQDITSFGLMEGSVKDSRTIHEFFIPCKVLLHPQYQGKHSHNSSANSSLSGPTPSQRIRLYRPPASNTYGLNDAGIKVTYENNNNNNSIVNHGGDGHSGDKQSSENSVPNINIPQTTASTSEGKNPGETNATTMNNTTAPSATVGNINSVDAPKTLRVLVIEDTIPVQKLLTRWLQNHGCEVTCANNGKIGLDYLCSQCFDITFVDFLMPVMLGITTMKLYQEFANQPTSETLPIIEGNKELLIVGMSATALESEQEEAFNYGMHFFCPKPVSLELLTLVLQAKREFQVNEEAVDHICKLMNVNVEDSTNNGMTQTTNNETSTSQANPMTTENTPVINNPTIVQMALGGPSSNGNNSNNGKAGTGNAGGGKEDNNKWILFRSKTTKVHPEQHK